MVGLVDETAGLEGNGGWAEFSSRVQAVVSYSGPTDFTSRYQEIKMKEGSVSGNKAFVQFLGGHLEEKPEIYKAGQPYKLCDRR